MLNNGWDTDDSKGVKGVLYNGTTLDDEWSYDRLVYKYNKKDAMVNHRIFFVVF